MVGRDKKVFVALSGGVDSSTAAALLLQEGFDCAGVFMITSDQSRHTQTDAEKVARELGMELYILDVRRDFERVIDYFCRQYGRGRTPNPCVFCNRYIKFGRLWDFVRSNGADFLATGHYARIFGAETGTGLYEAADEAKDQSYVLSMIDKDVLDYIILPMGEHSKDETRRMAAKFGLGNAERAESQEICFIPNGNYAAVLEQCNPELVHKGDIVDCNGRVLGEHNGVHRFTIGQRRGLRVAMGSPYYVVKIDAESNTVTLGPKEELMHSKLLASGVNWLGCEQAGPFRARVKIRYNDRGAAATVTPGRDSVTVEFDEPNLAITPGQLAAFYVREGNGSRVSGGAWIDRVLD